MASSLMGRITPSIWRQLPDNLLACARTQYSDLSTPENLFYVLSRDNAELTFWSLLTVFGGPSASADGFLGFLSTGPSSRLKTEVLAAMSKLCQRRGTTNALALCKLNRGNVTGSELDALVSLYTSLHMLNGLYITHANFDESLSRATSRRKDITKAYADVHRQLAGGKNVEITIDPSVLPTSGLALVSLLSELFDVDFKVVKKEQVYLRAYLLHDLSVGSLSDTQVLAVLQQVASLPPRSAPPPTKLGAQLHRILEAVVSV